jgi:hypothetical protein
MQRSNPPTIDNEDRNEDRVVRVHGTSRWLRERGVTPQTRHQLHLAIARGELPARELGPCLIPRAT